MAVSIDHLLKDDLAFELCACGIPCQGTVVQLREALRRAMSEELTPDVGNFT